MRDDRLNRSVYNKRHTASDTEPVVGAGVVAGGYSNDMYTFGTALLFTYFVTGHWSMGAGQPYTQVRQQSEFVSKN